MNKVVRSSKRINPDLEERIAQYMALSNDVLDIFSFFHDLKRVLTVRQ